MRKFSTTTFLAGAALFVAALSSAFAQPPRGEGAPADRPPGSGAGGPGMMGPGGGMMGGGMMGGGMGMGPGMMGGMGPGMGMMGMGGMMGPGMAMLWALDLDDAQRAKITKIQEENRKKDWELLGKIQDEQAKLRELYTATDTPDPKKVGAIYGAIGKLQQQLAESNAETWNRIHEVLTKEQREQLKQRQRGARAPGAGGGPMMRGPAPAR